MKEKSIFFTLYLKGIRLKMDPIACRAKAFSILINNTMGTVFYDRIINQFF